MFLQVPRAVYDGAVYAKVQMAVVCVLLIGELMLAKKVRNEGVLDIEDVIQLSAVFHSQHLRNLENLNG